MKGLKLSRGKQLNITQLPEKVISFTDFQIKPGNKKGPIPFI